MALLAQIVSATLLVAMFIYFLSHRPKKIDIQTLTLVAIFIVLSIVLDRLAFAIPIFGVTGLKISLSQLPLMLVGAIFGPFYAFFAGSITDGISLISNPTAFPFFGFTLNKVVIAMIPALFFYPKKKNTSRELFPWLLACMFIINLE